MDLDRPTLIARAKDALSKYEGTIYFKFSCVHCGARCTFNDPNALPAEGVCYKCGKSMPIKEGGMLLVIHRGSKSPTEVVETTGPAGSSDSSRKEESTPVAHIFLSHHTLPRLVSEMKSYAAAHPFDSQKIVKEMESDPRFKSERQGDLQRITGLQQIEAVKPYTRFVTLDGTTPLQVSYMHNPLTDADGYVAQLNVINCNRHPIKEDEKLLFCMAFLDLSKPTQDLTQQPHALVVCQLHERKTIPTPSVN